MAARDRDGGRWGKLQYSLSGDGVLPTTPPSGDSVSLKSSPSGDGPSLTSPHDKLLPSLLKGSEPSPGGGDNAGRTRKYLTVAEQTAPQKTGPSSNSVQSKSKSLMKLKQVILSENRRNESILDDHKEMYIQEQAVSAINDIFEYDVAALESKANAKIFVSNQPNDSFLIDYSGDQSNNTDGTGYYPGTGATVSVRHAPGSHLSIKRNRSASFAAPPTAVATPSVSQSQHWRDIKTAFSIDTHSGTIYVLKVSAFH